MCLKCASNRSNGKGRKGINEDEASDDTSEYIYERKIFNIKKTICGMGTSCLETWKRHWGPMSENKSMCMIEKRTLFEHPAGRTYESDISDLFSRDIFFLYNYIRFVL